MQELVNKDLIKRYLYASFFWLALAPLAGVIGSLQFIHPDLISGVGWLSYPRLRQFHVNGVAFGWFTTAAFGLTFYIVPRLTGRRLYSEKLAEWTWWLWNAAVLIGQLEILLGYNQGLEVAEYTLLVDILVAVSFVLVIYNLFATIFKRLEPNLYVSLWYLMGAFIWTALNYVAGNFVNPYFLTGANSAALHGFYLHNVVGLWVTPMGLAIAYFFLPVATRAPLFSHKLSLIGFWTIAFTYPFTGAHHYIFSPIADWVETIAIVTSMMLIIPVWTVVQNFYGTMKGRWHLFPQEISVKFLIVGIVYYIITCFQGPTQALRGMQGIIHFTDWVVGHAHLALFGVFTLWVMAACYYLWPRLTGKQLWSKSLTHWHFWLTISGFSAMALALWGAGLLQGTLLRQGINFVDSLGALKPYWLIRTLGGLGMVFSILIFVYNLWKSDRSGKPLNQTVQV